MNKFNEVYLEMFKRNYCEKKFNIILEDQKITIGDVICESLLPSPNKLIDNILNIQNNDKKTYTKNDILNLSNQDWKYYDEMRNVDDDFILTIIKCNSNDIQKYVNFNPELQGRMCEFCNPKNYLDEYIWISEFVNDQRYSLDDIRILLKHELGHVWTGLFGYSNNNFYDGRTNTEDFKILNPLEFNSKQKDVFLNMYKGNLNNLQNDFNYMFLKVGDADSNLELSTHIDEIIEILILDYFEQEKYFNSTNDYLRFMFSRIRGSANLFNDLNILKHYKNRELYDGLKNVELMLNIINRLFLILIFGNEKTIKYFKNACEEEFGKIN